MKDLKTLVEGRLLFLWKLAYQNAFNCLSENEEHASSPEISLWKETEGEEKFPWAHWSGNLIFFFFLILPQKMLGELIRMIFFFHYCSRTARSLGQWSEQDGAGIYCLVIQQEEMRSWGICAPFHTSWKNVRLPGFSHWIIKNYGKIEKIFPIQLYRQRPLQRKRKTPCFVWLHPLCKIMIQKVLTVQRFI